MISAVQRAACQEPRLEDVLQRHLQRMEQGDIPLDHEVCWPNAEDEQRFRILSQTDQDQGKKGVVDALVSRFFYSLSSISMILMNKSLTKR